MKFDHELEKFYLYAEILKSTSQSGDLDRRLHRDSNMAERMYEADFTDEKNFSGIQRPM